MIMYKRFTWKDDASLPPILGEGLIDLVWRVWFVVLNNNTNFDVFRLRMDPHVSNGTLETCCDSWIPGTPAKWIIYLTVVMKVGR